MSGNSQMKAAVLGDNGVEIDEFPVPSPAPHEMLVRVRACGLNRADLLIASGHRHGRVGGLGTRLGMEWAGDVVEVGSDVQGFQAGDRVMCSGAGGWAEFAVSDWRRTSAIPANNMTYEQAASLHTALNTMHDAVVTNDELRAGQSVLIQGASSGVGIMGLQIGKQMGAKLVIGSSTDEARRARLKEFGADLAIDSHDPDWVEAVLAATDGAGVDLIVDQISGYVANQNLAATKVLGRIVNVGRLGGFSGDFDFDLHAMRRIHYVGVTFRTRSIEEMHEIKQRMQEDLWAALESGDLCMPADRNFALDEVGDALDRMRENLHFGKITLTV